jgi:hypothetical protein
VTINKIDKENIELKVRIDEINNKIEKELKSQIINELKNENKINDINDIDNMKKLNEELKNQIDKLKIENEELKKKTNLFEEEINKLKNKIEDDNSELKSSINKLSNENNYLDSKITDIEDEKNERNKYYKNLFTDSKIIKEDERKLISKWILPHYNLKFELLYRASRDGFEPMAFHKRCDNKGPTLFVAKLSSNKRLGGFTRESWDLTIVGKKDEKAFLFSLDNKIKYGQVKKGIDAIIGEDNCSINFGPNGGADELPFVGKDVYCRGGVKYTFTQSELCGDFKTELLEMEVYSVKNYL